MDTTNTIRSIQGNWSIPNNHSDNEILPSSVIAGIPLSCLPFNLIAAVHSLSAVTIGQRDRAHKLLNTYYQARLREGNYGSKDKGMLPVLEVSDVEKACESARKMNRVMELQGFVPPPENSVAGVDQRTYSTTEQKSLPINLQARKDQERLEWNATNSASTSTESNAQPDQTTTMHDFDMLSPTTPYQDPDEDNDQTTSPSRFIMVPPPTPRTQKRLTHLPPIQTSNPPSPTPHSSLPPVQSSFTPLFKHLKEEFSQVEAQSSDVYLDWGLVEQRQQQQQQSRMDVDLDLDVKLETRVLAIQRATHEFNVTRMEVQLRKREYEEATWRCEQARLRLERLKRRGGGGLVLECKGE